MKQNQSPPKLVPKPPEFSRLLAFAQRILPLAGAGISKQFVFNTRIALKNSYCQKIMTYVEKRDYGVKVKFGHFTLCTKPKVSFTAI